MSKHFLQRLQPIFVTLTAPPTRPETVWPGVFLFRERLLAAGIGMAGALVVWSISWLLTWLPWWLVGICMVWDCSVYARRTHLTLKLHNSTHAAYAAGWIFWTVLLVTCLSAFTPLWSLPAYIGCTRYLINVALMGFVCLQFDGSPSAHQVDTLFSSDMLLGYLGGCWLLYDRQSLFSIVLWPARWMLISWPVRFFRWILPYVAPFELILWFQGRSLIPKVVNAVLLLLIAAGKDLSRLLDWCDIMEAYVMYHLPKQRQRQMCERGLKERTRSDVVQYKHLPLKPNSIRLLVLEQSTSLSPGSIRAEILHTTLESAPAFEAVSYRWGSSGRTKEIMIDGRCFAIPDSAFEVLLARRSFWRSRTLWIDAICINQDDDKEKSAQVQMMYVIYRKAERVILLPTFDWKARIAASAILEVTCKMKTGKSHHLEPSELGWIDLRGGLTLNAFSSRCLAYAALFVNEYFNRAWIVQEIVAGKEVFIYLGGILIPWDTLRQAVSKLSSIGTLAVLRSAGRLEQPNVTVNDDWYSQRVETVHTLRSDSLAEWFRPPAELQRLDAVLSMMAGYESSDPRDKVFAVAGLANQHYSEALVQPDYSLSVDDVYRDTARTLFFRHPTPAVDLLFLAGRGWHEESQLFCARPSWVPDFTGLYGRFPFTDLASVNPRFHAASTMMPVLREVSKDCLAIKGVLYSAILEVNETTPMDRTVVSKQDRATMDNFLRIVNFAQAAVDLAQKYHGRLSPNSRLVDALHADNPEGCSVKGLEEFQFTAPKWDALFNATKILSPTERQRLLDESNIWHKDFLNDASTQDGMGQFLTHLNLACSERKFGITVDGRFCVVPPFSRAGDNVWIPLGAQTPYIVRKKDNAYELIGEAYVQGIMQEEVFEQSHEVEELVLT